MNILRHLKFSSMSVFGMSMLVMMILGGPWMYGTLAIWVVVGIGSDLLLGRDLDESELKATWLLDMFLFLSLPIMLAAIVAFGWYMSSWDPFGIGSVVLNVFGYDMFAARAATTTVQMAVAFLGLGLSFGLIATNVGHELTHRTWSPAAQIVSRWLLALSFDTQFSIEHVYGHHRNVATREDPATAPRGQNTYKFVLKSTIGQNYHAFKLEKERLARLGFDNAWSWRNRMLRGQLMSLVMVGLFAYMAGWLGAITYVALGLYGKTILEYVNFMEHYGIVRVPGHPVEPRHSWNCNHLVSSWILYNLPRHSHHHARGEDPFWQLRAYPQSPMMPYGYLTMVFLTLVPPLYRKVMDPLVIDRDRRFTIPEEWPLIEQQNAESKRPIFINSRAHRENAGSGKGNAGVGMGASAGVAA